MLILLIFLIDRYLLKILTQKIKTLTQNFFFCYMVKNVEFIGFFKNSIFVLYSNTIQIYFCVRIKLFYLKYS